jgi:hypothetical protein
MDHGQHSRFRLEPQHKMSEYSFQPLGLQLGLYSHKAARRTDRRSVQAFEGTNLTSTPPPPEFSITIMNCFSSPISSIQETVSSGSTPLV